MDDVIAAIRNLIVDHTQLAVAIGRPGEVDTQISLLPWRVSFSSAPGNTQPVPPTQGQARGSRRPATLEVLVFSNGSLDNLLAAAEALHDNPVITNIGKEDHPVIHEQALTREEQLSLLRSARLPLQPVVCYAVTTFSPQSAALSEPR